MRLLVCGGAGFIGSNFIHYMLETYPKLQITNYDKLTYAGNEKNMERFADDARYTFVRGDICDLKKLNEVMEAQKISHAINFAAETHVDRSIHGGAKEFVLTNTLGVQMILDAINANSAKKFVNVSTDEVYGALELEDENLFTEETPIMPNMPYAAAKAGGDLMCHAYFKTHGTPVIVTHCSNNYGPYQFPEKLIPFFVFKLLAGENVPVYGDGRNVRDWIHVRDHVRALDILLRDGEPGHVYNIGSDNERDNLTLTKMIIELLGHTEERIEFVKDRPGHDLRYGIDATKMRSLGWEPEYHFDRFGEGLKETVDWYQENTDWVRELVNRKKDDMNAWQVKFFQKAQVA